MATRKSKPKSARGGNAKARKLPKGFTAISGGSDSWPNDSTKAGDFITVTTAEFKKVPTKFDKKPKDFNVCECEDDDGRKVTLWRSSGLAPVFEYEEGTRFYIEFLGMGKAKKGQNAPRLYQIGAEGIE